jgi:hypothetical protein
MGVAPRSRDRHRSPRRLRIQVVQSVCQTSHAHPFIKSIQSADFLRSISALILICRDSTIAPRRTIKHVFAEEMRTSHKSRSEKIHFLIEQKFLLRRAIATTYSQFHEPHSSRSGAK